MIVDRSSTIIIIVCSTTFRSSAWAHRSASASARASCVDYARAADEAGLHDISVGELRSTEVFALTAAIATATTNLHIETSIVAAVTRSPTLIAMGAATVAQLSGGRFRLGLGAGSPMVAGWHGADFARPLHTVERTLDLVRTALAGERVPELGDFRLAPEVVTRCADHPRGHERRDAAPRRTQG